MRITMSLICFYVDADGTGKETPWLTYEPLRNIPPDGSLVCPPPSVCKTWTAPRRNIVSYDPKITWPVNKDSDSKSE